MTSSVFFYTKEKHRNFFHSFRLERNIKQQEVVMKLNSKLKALIRQFPLLAGILADYPKRSFIDVKVKIMDADMLVYRADIGGYSIGIKGKKEGLVGREFATTFICNKDTIVHRHEWRSSYGGYLKDFFNSKSSYLQNADCYVVNVSHSIWHQKKEGISDFPECFGDKKFSEIDVVVWKTPKEGLFQFLRRPIDLTKGATIYNQDVVNSMIRGDGVYEDVTKKINTLVDLFSSHTFVPYLKAQIDGSKMKGMSCEVDGVMLLSYCMAGRLLLTVSYRGHEFTMKGLESEFNGLGLNHIRATYPEVEYMVGTLMRNASTLQLKDNQDVGFPFA